jgi:hypothetical protein
VRAIRIEPTVYETITLQEQGDLGKARYIILPIDLENQEQCEATNISLRQLFGNQIRSKGIGQGSIYRWKADLSMDQVSQAKSLEGVESAQPSFHHFNRRYVPGLYIIGPIDPQNQEECIATSASLAALVGDDICNTDTSYSNGTIENWSADLSNEQVSQVKAIHGVKSVRAVHVGRRCRSGTRKKLSY